MRHFAWSILLVAGLLVLGTPAWASAQSEIQAANAQGKTVFVVVTQVGAIGFDRAHAIAQQAAGMAPNTAVVVLDRGAQENQALAKAYRLLGAPVPLVLVVASNGTVTGGAYLKGLTPQKLVQMIPTPKKAEVLLHRTRGTPVILIASRKSMQQRSVVFEAATAAIQQAERKATTVLVDMDDKAERAYLQELNVNPKEAVPTTIVFNGKGKKTAVFRRVMTAKELFDALMMRAPCCPGGDC